MSTSQEIEAGQKESAQVEKQFKLDSDAAEVLRIQDIARPVLQQAKIMRPDINYQVKVLQSKEVNAFSLPGGWIYINTGLLEKAGKDDDAIACVIGHEAAHVVKRHVVKQIQDAQSKGLLVDIFGVVTNSNTAYQAVSFAYDLDQLHYSREDEYEADKYGLMFAYNAGYDPYGMPRFFAVLEKLEKNGENAMPWANDHPITRNRTKRVTELIEVLRANHGAYPEDSKK
jgi:predicted Zn-dependent protease